MEWLDRAACVGEDPELFFPVSGSGPSLTQIRRAQAVCDRCPVTWQCLDLALGMRHASGVWGGTTESDRAALLRPRRTAR
ncbi:MULTISPECIES: WhiB family transcriptional regulator [Streptomyces]|uniref:Transcriptional regulator WhiB n=1 Tax=Streptomyces xanthii TaxID=2768069 RepID=A0A7H1B259_9ACTN|nr:WhiB family transcriptional regulator [Streptomyces xanthii]QNS02814.1 WhiB family transcriptional regulator [Streptomyces xanthii]